MTAQEILGEIERLAAEHLDIDKKILPEMDLVEDLGLDSLKLLTLAVQVENRFRICIDSEDEEKIRSVADLISVIDARVVEHRKGEPS